MSCEQCSEICVRRNTKLAKRHGELCATRQKYSDLWDQMYGVADKTVIPESYSSRGTLPSDNPNPIKIMGDLSQVSKPARKRKKRRFRLGDSIESALSAVGVTQERVEEWVGGPCGCSGRKKKANALSDWAQDVLFGKITEEEGAEALEDLMNRKRAEAKTKTKSR